MAINYSLAMRPNPMDAEAPKKAYAQPQNTGVMNLDDVSAHISRHGSVWTEDVVNGVVRKLVKCVEELLLEGKRIELGNLGAFQASIRSRGAVDFQSFSTASNIKSVPVVWSRTKLFSDLRQSELGISFNRVLPKKVDADAKTDYYGE